MAFPELAKYEWADDTGLRHPSLVVVDATSDFPTGSKEVIALPVLRVKKIYSYKEYFKLGLLNRRKLPRIKGYVFRWYSTETRHDIYALYLGYERTQKGNE